MQDATGCGVNFRRQSRELRQDACNLSTSTNLLPDNLLPDKLRVYGDDSGVTKERPDCKMVVEL